MHAGWLAGFGCYWPVQLLWNNDHLQMEDKGTMTTVAACRALRPFALDFGCHAEGSAPVVVVVEAANTTPLPLSWELHR